MKNIIKQWYEAYQLVADLLIQKYGSKENPAKELYEHLVNSEFADLNRGRLFRDSLSRTNDWGLDPFQIFSTFNYTKISIDKRIKLINSLLSEFGSLKRVNDSTSFTGIPSPIITQIAQYRGWHIQNDIWKIVQELMYGGIKKLKHAHFIQIKDWRGIDVASFTMFLYWINSKEFLPLDKNTVEFLKSIDFITARPKSVSGYFNLCSEIKSIMQEPSAKTNVFRNIVEDSYKILNFESRSYELSQFTSTIIDRQTPFENKNENTIEKIRREKSNGFKIIGLRPLPKPEKGKQKHLKNLSEGMLYQFYNSYEILENDTKISYTIDQEIDLYSNENKLNISISAIVGMNGSGKSTIADFLYLIINKISLLKKINPDQRLINEEVYADLFLHLDTIYKISVGNHIQIFKYHLMDDDLYSIDKTPIELKNFDIESFFYSIAVNFSLYALNSEITGLWINPLFWKNDGYQVPLSINPMRNGGNVDVNNEEYLATSRLLLNILEPNLIDLESKVIPELVPGRTPNTIQFTFDSKKIKTKHNRYKEKYGKIDRRLLKKIIQYLVPKINPTCKIQKETKDYIFLKVVEIADHSLRYKKKYQELPNWANADEQKLLTYLRHLITDRSHATFKLKQAINFLTYNLYNLEVEIPIIDIISDIDFVKETSFLKTNEILPPSFMIAKVDFKEGGEVKSLSSGEKQQILSINTIIYHIYNIDSVMIEDDTYKYDNVNIIFDEIELYFHPEMQRTFIKNLLYQFNKMQLEYVKNINILFITHSPFILSDILSKNILRLKKGQPIKKDADETFASNIHDLLANDFFLERGYMGEFANHKIASTINILENWDTSNNKEKDNEKDTIFRFINLIGEPLIKESLLDLYYEKIGLHESEFTLYEIEAEIKRLENLKERISR